MSPRRTTIGIILGVICISLLVSLGKLVEDVSPEDIVVIQSPVQGVLDVYTTPGMKWQGFGEVTTFKKRSIYEFLPQAGQKDRSGNPTGGIVVRFNDGGHGTIFGSIQYELPSDEDQIRTLKQKYPSQEAVQHQLIEPVTNRAIYLVGTLMSSKQSYAEKRNDLIHYVTDQVQSGVYRTRQKTEWITDPVTKENRQVTTAEILLDKDGKPERQEESSLNRYGISANNFTIMMLPYDDTVEAQIKQQQQIAMDQQTSAAQANMAEQRARTAEAQGRANATEAKWKQETEKAQAVTLAAQQKEVAETNAARDKNVQVIAANRDKEVAETQANQRFNVAAIDRKAAEETKMQQIALGEGEAERKRLVLAADGALTQKLDTMVKMAEVYANAMRGSQWTPSVVLAGGGTATDGKQANYNGAFPLIDLMTAKFARDLSLDLSVPARPRLAEQPGSNLR